MKHVRTLGWIATGAAAMLAAALLFLLSVPALLNPHVRAIYRVTPAFKTPEEKEQLTAQAAVLGEPVFSTLYHRAGDEAIETYLPPRENFTHSIVGIFAKIFAVNQPVTAAEDVIQGDESEKGKVFVNIDATYPMQTRAVQRLRTMLSIGCGVGLLIAAAVAGFVLRRTRR